MSGLLFNISMNDSGTKSVIRQKNKKLPSKQKRVDIMYRRTWRILMAAAIKKWMKFSSTKCETCLWGSIKTVC